MSPDPSADDRNLLDDLLKKAKARGADASESAQSDATHHTSAFLPGLVENYVNKHTLPMRRDLTVLFVDIADSTRTIVERTPADALACWIQCQVFWMLLLVHTVTD